MSNAKMAVYKFQTATVKTNYFRMKKRLFILTLLIIISAIIGGTYIINSTGTTSCTGKDNGSAAGANAAVNAAPRAAMPALPVAGTIPLNNRTLNKVSMAGINALATNGMGNAGAFNLNGNTTGNGANALRFKAGGHLLQFGDKGMVAASASHALSVEFVGANAVTPAGEGTPAAPEPGITEPTPDNQPGKPAAAETQKLKKVSYPNLWQGVSLTYQATPQGVYETHYMLTPGNNGYVNAGAIRLRYNRDLALDKNGNLVIAYPNGTVTESAPIAWQIVNGKRRPVPVTFALHGARELGFTLGACAPGIAVEIDPTLTWNTFLGGSGDDYITGITLDSSGNILVVGFGAGTWGTPIRAYTSGGTSGFDVFVAKLTSAGSLVWNTFLGGNGDERFTNQIVLDSSGNIYVAGSSGATWGTPILPFTGSGNEQNFVAKLTSDGVLVWNTFTCLGGAGSMQSYGITIDSSGNIYEAIIATATWGSPIRAYTASIDCMVLKFNSAGTLLWNTFLGGAGGDWSRAITTDSSGNIYVAGYTISNSWGTPINPSPNGVYNPWIAKLTSAGALVWNTFTGDGSGVPERLITDGSGNLYIEGYSNATWGSPIRAFTNGWDGFVAKYTSAGARTWNTFLGGSGNDFLCGITIDGSGDIYVEGNSNDTWGTPVDAYTSMINASIAKLNSAGTLLWCTFMGSSNGLGIYRNCTGLFVDGSKNLYVADQGGSWGSPIRAYTSGGTNGYDGWVAKLAPSPVVTTQAVTNITSTTATGNGTIADLGYPASVTSYGVCWSSTNATPTITDSYVDNGATTATGAFTASMTGLTPGVTYYVRAYATNGASTGYGYVVTFTASNIEVWKGGAFQAGYTTLKGAFDAINAGTHTGDLVIKINASTTETASAALNYSGSGSASYTSINIYPTVSGLSISGNLSAPLIQLNGADNVTIDGRVNATGSDKDLTFFNTGNSVAADVIQFINGATGNYVQYCNVKGNGSNIILFSTSTSSYGPNSGNYIQYNNITNSVSRPLYAIYSSGSASPNGNDNNFILNNNIYDFLSTVSASYGIHLSVNSSSWTISGNSFYETTSFAPTNSAPVYTIIYVANANTGITISNNYIGGSSASCGGSAWTKTGSWNNTFTAIYMSVGTSAASSVQGNTIQNFNWSNSSSGVWYGMNLSAGNIDVGTVTGNTIGSGTGTGSISYTAAATGAILYGMYINSTGTVTCSNNIIGSITGANGATLATNIYGIYKTAVAGVTTISNNTIGSTSTANSINASSGSTTSGNAQLVYGIYNLGTGTINISGNTIANLTNGTSNATVGTAGLINGIYSGAGTNTVSGNTIRDLTIANANTSATNTGSVGGIVLSGTGLNTVTGNTIYKLSNTYASFAGQVAGIYFTGSTGANVCSTNFIHDLSVTGASSTTASIYGIKAVSGATTYSNNIISLGGNTKTTLYGLYDTGAASQTCNLYFNTIYLGGTLASGSANKSYCLYSLAASNTRNYRNNLLVNGRSTTGGSSLHYAISLTANTTLTCNYNDYYVTGTGGVLGYLSSDRATLSAWQTATTQDGNSLNVSPSFANAGGSAVTDYVPSYNSLCGITGTGITTDYTTATRTYNTMGAYDVYTIYPVEVWKGGVLQASYNTLYDAFAAINAGTHTGDLVVKINNNTTETATAVLNYSGSGSANYTSIKIYPTVSGLSISGNLAAPLINLNGADNVTIDGRVNQAGGTDLTIVNTSTSNTAGTSTIRFIADATNNLVEYCNIQGSETNATSGVVFFSTGTSTGNDNNTIDNNKITRAGTNYPANGVFSLGSASFTNNNITISNNWIYNILGSANSSHVFFSSNTTSCSITGNSLYEVVLPSSTFTYKFINIDNTSGTGFTVNNNYLGSNAANCSGTQETYINGATVYLLYLNVGTGTATNIQGNTISKVMADNGASLTALHIAAGDVNIGTTTANSFQLLRNWVNGSSSVSFYGINIASSGTVDCENNSVDNMMLWNYSGTSVATNTYAINYSGSGNATIKNNIINSIASGSGGVIATTKVYGIYRSGGGTVTIDRNTIKILSSTIADNLGVVNGITVTAGTTTVSNNTLNSLTNANTNTATDNTCSVGGIVFSGTGAVNTATGNTIYNLSNTYASFAGQVAGIYFTGSTGANVCSGNFIHDLTVTGASSTTASIYGIKTVSGATTYSNNIISLGGATKTTLYGLYDTGAASQTCNLYFNTIYLGGTLASGSTNKSYCLYSLAASNTRNYRNNLLVNGRSTTGGSSLHYAISLTANTTLTCNYNDYYVTGTGGVLGFLTSDRATLLAWQTATTQDGNSLNVSPSFANAGGSAATDYVPSYNSLCGITGTGITTDYTTATRTYNTMGAYDVFTILPVEVWKGGVLQTVYNTLYDAFAAINAGTHTGALEIKITANTTESTSAVLNASGSGSANYTSIKIYPTATGLSVSSPGGGVAAPLINLNGADNVTIDGRVNGNTGTSPDLTIVNTSATTASTIQFINGACNNTVQYCTLKGAAPASYGVVMFSTSSSTYGATTGNYIQYNNITNSGTRPINAIYSLGTASYGNNTNYIQNNNIYDFLNPATASYGINLGTNTSGWTISGNSFYETASFVPTASVEYRLINILAGDSYSITGNTLGGNGSGGVWTKSGTTYYNNFYGIYLAATTTAATSVQNNTIGGFTWPNGASTSWYGINSLGAAAIGTTTGNVIGGTLGTTVSSSTGLVTFYGISMAGGTASNNTIGGAGGLTVTSTTGAGVFYGINNTGTSSSITNNTIGGGGTITVTNSGAGTFYGIRSTGTAGVITGNTIGATTGTGVITVTNSATDGNCYGINSAGGTVSGNNMGAITAATSAAGLANNLYGIYTSGNTACTINNNTIGNTTTASSMNASSTSTANTQSVYGIYNTSTGTIGMSGNTIANLTNGTTNTTVGTISLINGIYSAAGSSTVSGNTIHHLTIANANASAAIVGSVGGIVIAAPSSVNTVTGNTIYNLSNTYATFGGQVAGIYFTGSTGANVCSGNFIHDLTVSSSSGASVYGIKKASGAVTLANNIVTLGVGTTNGYYLYGIYETGLASNNSYVYFNTVYLGGAPTSGSYFSGALFNAATSNTKNFRNNLLVNVRSNNGATDTHYAIWSLGTTGLTINYNDYYVSGTGVVLGYLNSNCATLSAWQTATTQDGYSLNANPSFANAGGSAATDYVPSYNRLKGVSGTGITTDYTTATRTYNTMGAYDVYTVFPVEVWKGGVLQASYNTLYDAFAAINAGTHTGDLVVKINDNTTEPATAVLNYSGSGSASYTSINIYPTASGLSVSGNLAAPLINLNGADNVTIDGRVNATGSAKDLIITNTNTSGPTIQFINGACSNTVQYCTIKGASSGGVSGIIIFSTSSSTYGATTGNYIQNNSITNSGTRPINAIYSAGTASYGNNANYILNNNIYDILRAGTNYIYLSDNTSGWTISGNSIYETTTVVPTYEYWCSGIYINNTSGTGFTISNNYIGGQAPLCGGSALTKTNAYNNSFYGIQLNVGTGTPTSVQGNTISNINWSDVSGAFFGIYMAAGDINMGTVTGNTIGSISYTTASTGTYFSGVYIATNGTVNCSNNTIGSITTSAGATMANSIYGIYKVATAGATTISNNTIGSTTTANSINATSASTANTQTVYGIYNLGTGANTISGNTIANLTNSSTFVSNITGGIYYGGSSTAGVISGNFINTVVSAGSGSAVYGINKASGNVTFSNNIISLGNNNPNVLYGIYETGAASNNTNLYFNTVYIGGSPTSGAYTSYALFNAGTTNTKDFRNNLLVNARSNNGATGAHYAISLGGTTGLTCNYNDYYAGGTGGVLGYLTSARATLSAWQTATAQDGNSLNVSPSFVSAGSSAATNYAPQTSGINGTGSTGIATDYFGVTRSNYTMGAIEQALAAVTTQAVSGIGATTATGNGTITSLGTPNPTAYGVCWSSSNATPTTSDSKVDNGAATATGAFTAAMTGLTPGTLYYVRAYATNGGGIAYGDVVTFTTYIAPTVTTQAVSAITTTTATGNGNITSLGTPASVTSYGVCWSSTNATPTTSDSMVDKGAAPATGAFTVAITGLTLGTTYYVRAFATNTTGTSYGAVVTFITSIAPTVTTQAVSGIGTSTATGNGNITSLGVPNPTAYGVCWSSTNATPTTSDSKVDNGAATVTGAFTAAITGLTPGTTYYVRAYATNAAGTSYGSAVTFTSYIAPTVTTQAVSGIGATTATGNGNITSLGIPNPTAYGVCWSSTNTNPTTSDSKVDNGAASATGAFTAAITGLTPGALYYVRAYATNAAGTSYGAVVTFTSYIAPTVTTQAVSGIGTTTATGNGNITSLGIPNPTAYGVCWSSSNATPTTSDSKVDNGAASATGAFTAAITGLTPGTLYYVRAYATNAAGTSYGAVVTFTSYIAPTVTTQAVSGISTTTATGNGNITSLGIPNPTAYGVCWSSSNTNPSTSDSKVDNGAASATGAFTAAITGLTPGTLYYVRAYATNAAGTSYGAVVTFTSYIAPTVTTQAVSGIGKTTATGNGNITSLGVPNPTAYGVCWSSSNATPTTSDSKVDNGAATVTGAFTAAITGLSPSTVYYVRAYATNAVSTVYGDVVSFDNTNYWKGATSADWNTASNWTLNLIPASGEDIYFAASPSNHCVMDQDRTIGSLYNSQSTYRLVTNGHKLTITGSFHQTGGAQVDASASGSTVAFAGSSAQTIPAGTFYNNQAYNLAVSNSNNVTLYGSLSLLGSLTAASGYMDATTQMPSVTYAGTSAQTLENNTWLNNQVYNLDISNTSGVTNNTSFTVSHNFTVNTGSLFTIAPAQTLTVNGATANNAGNAGFVIGSTAAGTGSLLHNTNNVAATVNRYIDGAASAWHFLSAPVSGQTIHGTGWTPGGTYGDGTGYDLYVWDEPTSCWVYNLNATVAPTWASVHPSGSFVPGRGYLYALQATTPTKQFAGNLGNGAVNYSVSAYSTGSYIGFNFLGNPYPSSIDWNNDAGFSRSMLQLSGGGYDIWTWSNSADNYGVYNSVTGVGTNNVTRYIAPMQGFMVRASSAGSFGFNNAARVHTGASAWLKSAETDTNEGLFRATVSSSTVKGQDEVLLIFGNEQNENGALKVFSKVGTAPSLYLPSGNDKYTVRYLSSASDNKLVPLSFIAGKNGNYTLRFAIPDTMQFALLEDKRDLKVENIKQTGSYTFSSTTGDLADRFILHFDVVTPLSDMPVTVYKSEGQVVINAMDLTDKFTVRVIDTSGRCLFVNTMAGNQIVSLPLMVRGVFLVTVSTSTRQKSFKIVN